MKFFLMSLFLLSLILTTTAAATTAPLPPPTITPTLSPSATPLPPPTTTTSPVSQELHPQQQLGNIIEALLGAGAYSTWVNLLSVTNPETLSITATIFIPADDSPSPKPTTKTFDPLIFPYHIVPRRLNFSDLCHFNISSRLPTFLSSKSILVTNNSVSNFTLDGSLVTHPDLFTNENIAVHGIAALLDYSVYGDANPKKPVSEAEVWSRPPHGGGVVVPEGEMVSDHSESGAGYLRMEFFQTIEVAVFCAFLVAKIQRLDL
ncbi:FAS1 domain-containing protein SELMODRAFT_448915-like [Mercurialis annua]|uniref:FAS1 domain-containing protein SELMODRAFT_448915-like n=1 Tax=Mercurialis annua TaxID=3986 RepID=UPI00215E34FC|nr:FAS1 domain-containing protein SELMODRAFT_448915-like [Mercurialis annua]